ncbi:MAG: WD40 repeat domain-containing protein [Chitinophagaceae bacterium]|nr:WD40 repeat domain-containing protein [Chitinophagaceae bacterium]
MKTSTLSLRTPKRPRKRLFFLLVPITLITLAVVYIQLFQSAKVVDSGIYLLEKTFAGHDDDVWAVQFSPDGSLIASGSVDSTVILRTLDGRMVKKFKHPEGVTGLAISRDGNFVVTSSYDGIPRIWKISDSTMREFHGHKGTVWTIDISPDGRNLASGGEDGVVRIWNTETGQVIHELKGHALNVWSVKFSPDGATLASGSFDKKIILWEVESGRLRQSISGHTQAVVAIAYSNDGKTVASTSDDKTIRLWNSSDGKPLRTLKGPREHVQAVTFSPDDTRLLTGGRDKPNSGEFLQNFFGDSKMNPGVSMRLWDIATGDILQTFSGHENDANDVAFSADGKWIVSGSADNTVQMWKRSSMSE